MLRTAAFKTIVIVFAMIVCATVLSSAAFAYAPTAVVYTVGNDGDTGGLACDTPANCTLRSAVQLANSDGADTDIVFTTGVHTITLGSALNLTADTTWIGANTGRTVFINANNAGQAFVISGSEVTLNNLYIYGSGAGTSNIYITGSAKRVTISNNYIGTYLGSAGGFQCDVSPNSYSGIYIDASGAIGAGEARAWIFGNHIACNKGTPGDGIDILTDHVIVGADAAGVSHANSIQSNQRHGVEISGAGSNNNVIRDSTIMGNQNGVVVDSGAQLNSVLTNTLEANHNLGVWFTGVDTRFNVAQANNIAGQENTGVQIDGSARDNVIGSVFLSSGNGNQIYGNTREGVYIAGADTRFNSVFDNRIGLNGQNGHNGIVLDDNTHGNVIGDIGAGRNIISDNGWNGVEILNGAYDNTVRGNYIGTGLNGTTILSNTLSGVSIHDGAHDNTLDQNLIGGNGVYGVIIDGSTTSTNTLTLNLIGNYLVPNGWDGLALTGGTFGNTIGGDGVPNNLASNLASGIYVAGGSHNNSILRNFIQLNYKYGVIFDGGLTANNVISRTAIYNNGLDGIAIRNGANQNVWTEIITYGNGGLGINTQAIDESTHVPHPPDLSIVAIDRSTGLISGKANITSFPFFTKVELYRVAPDPSGYGEGRTFVGSAFTDNLGDWYIIDPAFTSGCYTGFTTETTLLGTGSTEFIRNNCMTFLPVVLK